MTEPVDNDLGRYRLAALFGRGARPRVYGPGDPDTGVEVTVNIRKPALHSALRTLAP